MASKLPKKKDVALALLEQASVFIHLDPRRDGVQVPVGFKKQAQLVLQIGLNMVVKIPDLEVDDEGISCTLSFNRRPHYCHMPWGSIYALVDESGRGMVWPDDVPPEVVAQQREGAKKTAGSARPRLRAVDESESLGAESQGAEPQAAGSQGAGSQGAGSQGAGSQGAGSQGAGSVREKPRAAEPLAASAREASPNDTGAKPKRSEPAPAREATTRTKSGKMAAQTDGASQASPAGKSSRPPYLRLVK